jgi:hypothetical protein
VRGKSTRCNVCAKKQAGHWRKNYLGYADILVDDEARRRLLGRYSAARTRCECPTAKQYANYGGRGIQMFPEWMDDRAAFLRYVITLEGWDNPTLEMDRIDNDKGYEPDNLRFITKRQNMDNRRTVRDLQERIHQLEACLRHCTCGAAQSLHDQDE